MWGGRGYCVRRVSQVTHLRCMSHLYALASIFEGTVHLMSRQPPISLFCPCATPLLLHVVRPCHHNGFLCVAEHYFPAAWAVCAQAQSALWQTHAARDLQGCRRAERGGGSSRVGPGASHARAPSSKRPPFARCKAFVRRARSPTALSRRSAVRDRATRRKRRMKPGRVSLRSAGQDRS